MADKGDVLDSFLLWELSRKEGLQQMILEGHPEEELIEVMERVRKDYERRNYDHQEKMDQVRKLDSNPDHRSKIIEYCEWSKEKVKVKDLGTTLPHAMGLPPEVITGSLPEVLDFVRKADPEEYRSVQYIQKLKDYPEILNKFQPAVVTPGKILRKQERMNKAHGNKDWGIEKTWGAIHDGNHRTIAKILANEPEEIQCYVGRPSNNKIHEHVEP